MSKILDLWSGLTATVLPFAGSTAPTGWLLCYGQAISRTTYATLFTAIGTTYGTGDGSTTFNLPDMRGRLAAGKDNMGGTAANRLTTAGSAIDGATLGANGGAETQTLTGAQLPAHNHPVFLNDPGHTHAMTPASPVVPGGGTSNGYTSGSYGLFNASVNSGTTGITVRDTTGGAGTANQTANSTGGGGAHNNAQPTLVLNHIIKI